MWNTTMKYGTVVGVGGSAESDAVVVWATHEAVLPHVPITLPHADALVGCRLAGGPWLEVIVRTCWGK
jgi:hypothetical protein